MVEETKQSPRLMVSLTPSRWGKTFHLFDRDGREIALELKDATRLARTIIKEAKK